MREKEKKEKKKRRKKRKKVTGMNETIKLSSKSRTQRCRINVRDLERGN